MISVFQLFENCLCGYDPVSGLSGGLVAARKEVKASSQPVKASKVGLVWNKNFAKHLVGKRDQTTANNIKGTGPRPQSGA